MKRYPLFFTITLLMLICIAYPVQAYIITIDAPKTMIKGTPLTVTGSTSFPEDSYFDLVLFYSKYTAGEVARTRVIVDKTQVFRVDFDTRNLEKGQYKVEVHNVVSDNELFVERQLGSSSVVRKIVQITDRSDEITLTSPQSQQIAQALTISGRMRGIGDGVLTVRLFGPYEFMHGPQQVITKKGFADNSGEFSTTIPVPSSGEYQASISDKSGYIGEYTFTVSDPSQSEGTALTTEPTEEPTSAPTPVITPETIIAPPSPTPTQSSFPFISLLSAIIGAVFILNKKD
ncbi:hypothetical protein KSK55_06300 [Methanospirillum purgamenti]|jgi:hypothetical protein|uniref:Uncharacterized protein n=1 Tax=Methanospirillum hungatei TaxID=2203 RepID=A0A8F5VMV1_METHU|nr:hypothetical protein [Methanospirillum hungatei]QXO95987.1 hypothetical protein KSK55_06300 [Methanospirillum hungatei]